MKNVSNTLARNKKARHDYEILETFEAGIQLTGTEVKSCREHNINLSEGYAKINNGELWLCNVHIAQYKQGNRYNHSVRRDRRLLVHKRELRNLLQATQAKGLTVLPLSVYLRRQHVKVELGLARGKRKHDKRETMKRRIHDQEARVAMAGGRRRT